MDVSHLPSQCKIASFLNEALEQDGFDLWGSGGRFLGLERWL